MNSDKLSQLYDKLLDYYLVELNKEDPDVQICKEVRELLKAMKYEAPLVAGSKQDEVLKSLEKFPKFVEAA